MSNLIKIKFNYFLKLKNSYLIKIDNMLNMCHMWHSCGIFNLINVAKINHLDTIDYDCDVTFYDVAILK